MAAPGGSGPIGPYPPHVAGDDDARDEYDRLRRRVLWSFPSGLYLVGSRATIDGVDRRNLMTLNWATQVSFEPKLVGIGVEQTALTHQLISEGRVFTLATISRDDRAIVRKFTKPVDVDESASTANGFEFTSAVTGAPILTSATAYVDCEVREAVTLGGHTFFVGEVVDAAFRADEDTEVLRMEDTRMNYGG
jgi:flavin reductase (DIM6/NTAB) family NADH-FMN oxidoreductase RutF